MNSETLAVKIDGMFCDHCITAVTRAIQGVPYVESVQLKGHIAVIKHTGLVFSALECAVAEAGYHTDASHIQRTPSPLYRLRPLGVFALLVCAIAALGYALELLVGYNIFNAIPLIDSSLSYGALVITGVTTSLHCLSMCGAINLAATAGYEKPDLKTPILYNLGRLVSYTALGGLAGFLGGIISIDRTVSAVALIAATIAMIAMSLNMAGVITFRLPRFGGPLAEKASRSLLRGRGSFAIGLANGAMPCGPLQAMQLFALSTGSAAAGALSMFLFCLGTLPLMVGIGYAANLFTGKRRALISRIAAAFMFVLAISMLGRGLSIAGANPLTQISATQTYTQAALNDGVQTIAFDLEFDDYENIQVKAGIPVEMTINVDEEKLTGCNNEVIMPSWGISQKLQPGANIITFTPYETGTFEYSCWMNMIRNSIIVTE